MSDDAKILVNNAIYYGEDYWSIYNMIQESNLLEWEKIEGYKYLLERIEKEYFDNLDSVEKSDLWQELKTKIAKMKNIHKRELVI